MPSATRQMRPTATSGPKPRRLESVANPEWKALRKTLAQGSLLEGRYWVAETPRLLAEAVRSGLAVPRVYASSGLIRKLSAEHPELHSTEWVEVAGRALQAATAMESSQEVLALVERPRPDTAPFFARQRFLVVLDQVQDPGNAGAIARSAEAFGATGLVFLRGSASPDAPKVLRASAGSLFRVPFLHALSVGELLASLGGFTVYGASPEAQTPLESLEVHTPAALVIGNEGAGISRELEAHCVGFRIPTRSVESLNAAVSAGIALYVLGTAITRRGGNR